MARSNRTPPQTAARLLQQRSNPRALAYWGLRLSDLLGLVLSAYLASLLCDSISVMQDLEDELRWAMLAALPTPLLLGSLTATRPRSTRRTIARFLLYVTLLMPVIALMSIPLHWYWPALWFGLGVIWILGSRQLLPSPPRETVAVVGSGAIADQLLDYLRRQSSERFEIVGVFDQRQWRPADSKTAPSGDLIDLVRLSATRRIDWAVLTLPGSADQRILQITRALSGFNGNIVLCPQDIGLRAAAPATSYVGAALPVTVLTKAHHTCWELDDYDLATFTELAANFGQERYAYMVTPNADHLIRLHEDPNFRALYADAGYVLLDSRFLANALWLAKRVRLPVCAGSDLTARLFENVIAATDPLVLIGGTAAQAQTLRQRHGLSALAHHNPPMGFIKDPEAIEQCLQFIEQHSPFRFCLLAVGSPQQELLAQQLQQRGHARGLALCIGASIDFLTGYESRAPRWLQRSGLEWLYRLVQQPERMARRYLLRGPRLFQLLPRTDILLRRALFRRR